MLRLQTNPGDQVFNGLLKIIPLLRPRLSARLTGVNGFTGRGVVGYRTDGNGARKLSVQLRGLAGRKADIVADETPAASVTIKSGRGAAIFTSSKGHKLPDLCEGARIDVHQNGEVVLSGVLTRK